MIGLLVVIFIGALAYLRYDVLNQNHSVGVSDLTRPAAKPTILPPNPCKDNSLSKLIIVSVSKRRTWACSGQQLELSTSVITGNENLASDLTPTGTYHILDKQTNVKLIGCDTDQPNVCWNDFVHYDMIFLYNQYGHYDFHDATWRKPNDFGNISPYSANASHGCVETPLAAMKWLYSWASVGTTINIES